MTTPGKAAYIYAASYVFRPGRTSPGLFGRKVVSAHGDERATSAKRIARLVGRSLLRCVHCVQPVLYFAENSEIHFSESSQAYGRAPSVRPCLRLFASPSSAKSTNELGTFDALPESVMIPCAKSRQHKERKREREKKGEEAAFAVNYPRNAREIVNGSRSLAVRSISSRIPFDRHAHELSISPSFMERRKPAFRERRGVTAMLDGARRLRIIIFNDSWSSKLWLRVHYPWRVVSPPWRRR